MSDEALRQAALAYHAMPRPGKIGTHVFKPAESSRDLALAYSPGVAEPVLAIAADPEAAYEYTNKGQPHRYRDGWLCNFRAWQSRGSG